MSRRSDRAAAVNIINYLKRKRPNAAKLSSVVDENKERIDMEVESWNANITMAFKGNSVNSNSNRLQKYTVLQSGVYFIFTFEN